MLTVVNKYEKSFYDDDYRNLRVKSGKPAIDILQLIRFFIEALHEEMNLIDVKPPQCEVELDFVDITNLDEIYKAYKKHIKLRENSFIRDLFCGLMYNEYKC